MIFAAASSHDIPFIAVEAALTVIAVGLALAVPRLGSQSIAKLERALAKFAARRGMAVATVGFTAFFLRLALLPLCPIPQPFVLDDFSFLLAANTFASGRLTNPTPAMWQHFESFQICMQPTYMSMYFPGNGMILAAGKLITGNPWFGLLAVTALMCAALCWMLQAWLPSSWAFLGGMIAVTHIALFSYWINTFTGAGSLAALGGALVLGAFPRIMRTTRFRDAVLLATGIIILALTRPYEGLLVCLPVAFVLGRWLLFGKNCPSPAILMRRAALPVAMLIAAAAWMLYYDARVNGNPLTLPYTINRATYAVAPYYIWQKPRPEPVYRHPVMRDFYLKDELPGYEKLHQPFGFLKQSFIKTALALAFFTGFALLPPLFLMPRVFRDRRMRFFAFSALLWGPGMLIQIFLLTHYVAAFTAAIYLFGIQAMRHLRQCRFGDQPIGAAMVRYITILCVVLLPLRAIAGPLHLALADWPGTPTWTVEWYGPGPYGEARAAIERQLESLPGKQLILVRYSSNHHADNEWVANAPDIDNSQVIWAREMDAANNTELLRYYHDRKAWLIEPDAEKPGITPYPESALPISEVR